jgi:endonuclease YncB( thermonuclease family)
MKIRFGTKFIYSCFFLLVLLSCAIGQFENQTLYEAQVTSVTDGDTIVVQFTGNKPPPECSRIERVRFIGVNTPELTKKPMEVFAREARDYTNRL